MSARFPGRKLSALRVSLASLVVTALAGSAVFAWSFTEQNDYTPDRWFGGYVDITAMPTYSFESKTADSHKNMVLSFIVADGDNCTPSWGGYYTLPEAAQQLDLDRKIQRVLDANQEVVISFGGLKNDTLAAVCTSPETLAIAYEDVLDHYALSVIDFDIEADDIANAATRENRVAAAKLLQEKFAQERSNLGIWLTLPADQDGLTGEGVAVVSEFLSAGVSLAGVNLMVMNFGVPSLTTTQAELTVSALQSAHAQLTNQFWLQGTFYSNEQVWRRLGATAMIGQNDLADETFTLQDAREVHAFAESVELGRTSFWSLNRDQECAANYPNITTVSDFCSGVAQAPGEFAKILSAGLPGSAADAAEETNQEDPTETSVVVDDPETSPYPIWNKTASYPVETKVVWQGNVYTALWWSRGDQPDLPLENGESPWRLVGPVLPGETPVNAPILPEGFYPTWDATQVYESSTRVLHDGIAFEAKWWTLADSPDKAAFDTDGSPWERLDQRTVQELLDPDSAQG